MSEKLLLAIIGLVNTCIVAWLALHQSKLAQNIQKIETATNSMKDALVKSTAEASHLEGMAAERARAKAETASNTAAIAEDKKNP